jgi:SAM-dependent methyltransferase
MRRLSFNLWYLRRPPWDSGIVPPEVVDFIHTHPLSRALDLGCGTGTSSLALAKAGWQVTGVDFVPRAIRIARAKAKAAGVSVDFRVGDVTRLMRPSTAPSTPALPAPAQVQVAGGAREGQTAPLGAYDLVLDIGCFHGLSSQQKRIYLAQLPDLLTPSGTWLMYGFFKLDETPGPGLFPGDLEIAALHLTLVRRQDGVDKKGRASAWFWFQKA